MKHSNIVLLLLFIITLASCKDADDRINRMPNTATIHEGTRFILYDREFNALDTIVVEETRILEGTTSIQEKPKHVGYSINGMGYIFNTYNVLENIFFNLDGDRLYWIGSRTISSGFHYQELTVNKLDDYNIELEFVGEKSMQNFGTSNNYFNMLIEGKISFNKKTN